MVVLYLFCPLHVLRRVHWVRWCGRALKYLQIHRCTRYELARKKKMVSQSFCVMCGAFSAAYWWDRHSAQGHHPNTIAFTASVYIGTAFCLVSTRS